MVSMQTLRAATAMTGLPAFATSFRCELRILRKAAFLIGYALTALASCDCRELPILRETAFRAGNALASFASGLGRQAPILREAALLIRHGLAAHACDLALPLRIHRCESTVRRAPILSWCVS